MWLVFFLMLSLHFKHITELGRSKADAYRTPSDGVANKILTVLKVKRVAVPWRARRIDGANFVFF